MLILEGKNMYSKESLHNELKSKLGFPDSYGNNLDALWDCLTSWITLPEVIEWKDFNITKEHLGDYAQKVLTQFEEAEDIIVKVKMNIFQLSKP